MASWTAPIPGTHFGALVEMSASSPPGLDCTKLLHDHGLLLFRGLQNLNPKELHGFVCANLPKLPDLIRPKGITNGIGDEEGLLFTKLGNTKDPEGRYVDDFVPCTTHGAPMRQPTDAQIQASLKEWFEDYQLCTYMEWHSDALFTVAPPSYNGLFCKMSGGSSTAFSDAMLGVRQLPPELLATVERATFHYKPSIMYKMPIRAVQVATWPEAYRRRMMDETAVFSRPLLQVHPHTGEKVLRYGDPRTLHTVNELPPMEGQELAWKILRAATRDNVYVHAWQPGDLIVWDQRRVLHSRVPYDTERSTRLMWRMEFRRDPLDQAYLAAGEVKGKYLESMAAGSKL